MPPIQHNFKNLDEYNSYAKAHGMNELKPTETTGEDGQKVTQDPEFPKSVWEVYAEKDGNRNDKVGFNETGIEQKDVTQENKETLKNSLLKNNLFKGGINGVEKYATDAWNRVSQNIEKLFAKFDDIEAKSKQNITDEASAKSAQEELDKGVQAGIESRTNGWETTVSEDIKTQLAKALEIAQKELGVDASGDDHFATKDKDRTEDIDLNESGIKASDITGGSNIKEKVAASLGKNEKIKEFGINFDVNQITDSAAENLDLKADKTIKTGYKDIEAKAGMDQVTIDTNVDEAIKNQIGDLKGQLSIDDILKQAEIDAMNQIRDEINKARNEAHQKAEGEEGQPPIGKDKKPQEGGDATPPAKGAENPQATGGENLQVDGKKPSQADDKKKPQAKEEESSQGSGFGEALAGMAATIGTAYVADALGLGGSSSNNISSGTTTVTTSDPEYTYKRPSSLGSDSTGAKTNVRNSWGSQTLSKAQLNDIDINQHKKDGSLNVQTVIQKMLGNLGSLKGKEGLISQVSNHNGLQKEVIQGNPEVFDKKGQAYSDADWNSLRIPNVKKIEEITGINFYT